MFKQCVISDGIEEWRSDIMGICIYDIANDQWKMMTRSIKKELLHQQRAIYLSKANKRVWNLLFNNVTVVNWKMQVLSTFTVSPIWNRMCYICHISKREYYYIEIGYYITTICDNCLEKLRTTIQRIQYTFLMCIVDHRDVRGYILLKLRELARQ